MQDIYLEWRLTDNKKGKNDWQEITSIAGKDLVEDGEMI